MKTLVAFVLFLISLDLSASPPRSHTPPAPTFHAAEAARLADEYVAKTFPQFPDLYCYDIRYDDEWTMKPDPTVIWRLRYFIPNNPLKPVEGRTPDWGMCLIFVHKDKRVTHTIEPQRNPEPR